METENANRTSTFTDVNAMEAQRAKEVTKIGVQRVTVVAIAVVQSVKEGIEVAKVTKVKNLRGHMCDRNQSPALHGKDRGHRRGHNGSDRRRNHS
ncbi:hypothetical protein PoB_001482500 [Plakobranchus ocellatus]|uniref:Uncharacterized protein n=1 Tax=Plakobranchus ocellatus TaxID=259542 RepID=A0AAV3YZE2_9GAST|nr:hypothetical protein PoB_001482500 [Plakobranchus ocellatus]